MTKTRLKKTVKVKRAAIKSKMTSRPPKEGSTFVGRSLPRFKLRATGERVVTPADFKGKTLVLYFYPKDATPGCTLQGQDFTRLHDKFKAAGAEVLGVSRDSIQSHEKFKAKQNYSIDLISDEDESLCQLFDVIKMKNMYGKKVRGIERSTFVVDASGKVVKEWRKVKVPEHAEEVLEFVRSL